MLFLVTSLYLKLDKILTTWWMDHKKSILTKKYLFSWRLDPESQKIDQELRNIFERLKKGTCGTEKITKTLEIHNGEMTSW